MATTPSLNRIFESLPTIPKLRNIKGNQRKSSTLLCTSDKKNEIQESPVFVTRRLALGLASVSLFLNNGNQNARAEDNGFWVTTPLPVPSAINKINNEETGTRSFIKKGIYIANIGTKGSIHRLKRYAFDLIALGDLIAQKDAWNYVRKYLRLKTTFMYCDFDKVISAASVDDKQPLTDLANRLFDNVEKLLDAVKEKNFPQTESIYQATTPVLEEIMIRMA